MIAAHYNLIIDHFHLNNSQHLTPIGVSILDRADVSSFDIEQQIIKMNLQTFETGFLDKTSTEHPLYAIKWKSTYYMEAWWIFCDLPSQEFASDVLRFIKNTEILFI